MIKKFKHLNKKYMAVISSNEACTGCEIPHSKDNCSYKRCFIIVDEYVISNNQKYFNKYDSRLNIIFKEIK